MSEPAAGPEPQWRQRAAFSVFFDSAGVGTAGRWRTRVYHEESGEEITLSEPDLAWVSWIGHHLDADLPESQRPAPPPQLAVRLASTQVLPGGPAGRTRDVRLRLEFTLAGLADLGGAIGEELARVLLVDR